MASTTKIMTGLIVLERAKNLKAKVAADNDAVVGRRVRDLARARREADRRPAHACPAGRERQRRFACPGRSHRRQRREVRRPDEPEGCRARARRTPTSPTPTVSTRPATTRAPATLLFSPASRCATSAFVSTSRTTPTRSPGRGTATLACCSRTTRCCSASTGSTASRRAGPTRPGTASRSPASTAVGVSSSRCSVSRVRSCARSTAQKLYTYAASFYSRAPRGAGRRARPPM